MRYRPPERQEKFPVKKSFFVKRWFFRFVIFSILLFGIVFLLRVISYSKSLSISGVEVSGTIYADSESIEKIVDRYLNDPVLNIFSRKNIFLISVYRLEEYIKKENKGLKGVRAEIKERVLHLSIVEYKPNFLWCGDTPPIIWDEIVSCFYASDDGFIFSKAPFFSGDVYVKFYGPLGEGFSVIPIGSRISNLTDFLNLVKFKNDLKNMGLQPESIALSGLDTISVILWRGENRQEEQASPKIIFNRSQNLETLSRHLRSAISSGELKDFISTKYDKLIFIDLRTDNKVLYKFLK